MKTGKPVNDPSNDESNKSTSDAESSSGIGSHGGEPKETETIAMSETKAVKHGRVFVALFVFITMISVALGVYFYLDNEEQKEFRETYEFKSNKMYKGIQTKLRQTLGLADTFTTTIVSVARYGNQTWPMTTLPDYPVQAGKLRFLASALNIEQYHFVLEEEVVEWDEFTSSHNGWLNESIYMMENDEKYHGEIPDSYAPVHDIISASEVKDDERGETHHDSHEDDHEAKNEETHGGTHHDPHEKEHEEEDGEAHHDTNEGDHEEIEQDARSGAHEDADDGIHPGGHESEDGGAHGGPHDHDSHDAEEQLNAFLPMWQSYPAPLPELPAYNLDGSTLWTLNAALPDILIGHQVVFSASPNIPRDANDENEVERVDRISQENQRIVGESQNAKEPFTQIYYPILEEAADIVDNDKGDHHDDDHNVVGVLSVGIYWRAYLEGVLPGGEGGVVVAFENSCDQIFSFEVEGGSVTFLGLRSGQAPKFNNMYKEIFLSDLIGRDHHGLPVSNTTCAYKIRVYPSLRLEAAKTSNDPIVFAIVAAMIFVFTAIVFVVYDRCVERRQRIVMRKAERTSEIVSSLFPSNVRDRLIPNDKLGAANKKGFRKGNGLIDVTDTQSSMPIADLFPECTVMFCDIAGFTAWSSMRQPEQVFQLLEALYGSFDEIARKRGVFKVETIGDSYVAVSGLPRPRKDHAIVMAKFAKDCNDRMAEVVRSLEVSLGPDTGELGLRLGLNSGAVTAGVLRVDKGRFQLFGDTVNTASRMESTGENGRVQASQGTYDQLVAAGKAHWCTPRKERVEAKGKGSLQTFWVEPKAGDTQSVTAGSDDISIDESIAKSVSRDERLVDWNVDVLASSIGGIIAKREALRKKYGKTSVGGETTSQPAAPRSVSNKKQTVIDEVVDFIELPTFENVTFDSKGLDSELDERTKSELRQYVSGIASIYQDNAFHNFEHASHVCMSVVKLLSRIAPPSQDQGNDSSQESSKMLRSFSHYADAITTDPLLQFACIFSALIHDTDHPGVPNSQLVEEKSPLARLYNGKSVAEQNSVDIAWTLLKNDAFKNLRKAICPTAKEEQRLRQLVVNGVMATDVMDRSLIALRNRRWTNAFESESAEEDENTVNRQATIVIEHLIQASDVAHTMQHWHIYRKWNERLYREQMTAYHAGRAQSNPTENWYNGELGFLDFYVIPLAKKLAECGVFGVSSHEYLEYATKNRQEWEVRGKEIVEQMSRQYMPSGASAPEHLLEEV